MTIPRTLNALAPVSASHWLLAVVVGVMLAGCGESPAGQHPAGSDVDRFNQRVAAINHAWEQFRVGGNACPITPSAGPCLAAAIQDSGIQPATGALRVHVKHVESSLSDGTCRRALRSFDARLAAFHRALDTLRRDAAGGQTLEVLLADTHRVRPAWNAATAAEEHSTNAC
jgi:hypothetical protein